MGPLVATVWTPAAVLIGVDGKISSEMTAGDEAIRALVNHTIATGAIPAMQDKDATTSIHHHRPRVTVGSSLFKVGEPAPRFSLPNVSGRMVNSEELLSRDTLLLFWDAQCSFCQAMTGDLTIWDENPPEGLPQLVYIASGSVDEAKRRRKKLKSLTLIDADFDIGPMFGTNSTPAAVLIDREGRIASSLAKGSRNILALAGIRKVELPIAQGLSRLAKDEQSAWEAGGEAAKG